MKNKKQETEFEYEPGDAIGVICSNNTKEVDNLLARLNLIDQADTTYVLSIKKEVAELKAGAKPKYEIPSHLPSPATLRYALTNCCEIRSVPRKVNKKKHPTRFLFQFVLKILQALIRVLAEFASSETEKRRLLELCSVQGSEDYTELIRKPNINVLDLLNSFPSCQPPIESLFEHLPRLLARPYSLSTSPLIVTSLLFFFFASTDRSTFFISISGSKIHCIHVQRGRISRNRWSDL